EIGRFGLQMHGKGHLHAIEGLFTLKIRLDAPQHRHISPHPGYLALAGRGEGYVSDIVHIEKPPHYIYNSFILTPARACFKQICVKKAAAKSGGPWSILPPTLRPLPAHAYPWSRTSRAHTRPASAGW